MVIYLSIIFEIVIFTLISIGSVFTKAVTLPLAIKILLSGTLTIIFLAHIVFYILNLNSELRTLSVNKYHKIIGMSFLTISKFNRNFIIYAFTSGTMMGCVINFNESKTSSSGGPMGLLVTLLTALLDLALCFVFIFVSNKLDTYTIKFVTDKLLYPLSIANLIISQILFLLVQSLIVYGYANASDKLFNNTPIINNLFENPILFDYIYSLF